MGFFQNLFEKKVCDICGEEIGLLGNRKLEDGNCCKSCAKKLSPWFTERKHSTIHEIKDQLAAREENREAVASFHTTRSFGKNMKVLVDEPARKFMVTRARDLAEANPDVLDFSQVTACDLDVKESRSEVYRRVRDSEGNRHSESYSPRRYQYSYDFQMTIVLNHPYIDEIEFSLSDGSFQVEARNHGTSSFFDILDRHDDSLEGSVNPPSIEDRRSNDDYIRYESWAVDIRELLLSKAPQRNDAGFDFTPILSTYTAAAKSVESALAAHDEKAAGCYREVLMQARKNLEYGCKQFPEEAVKCGVHTYLNNYRHLENSTPLRCAPSAPDTVICPWCGSRTSARKFCENCGGKLTSE